MFAIPTWILGIAAGWKRIDVVRLAIAAVVAGALILAWFTVARLIDGAVADWKLAQEREKAAFVERMAQGAAIVRERYERETGKAVRRAVEVEQELAKFTDGDPVVYPRSLVRRLNQ
jgi:hypothetical protein